MPNLNPIYFTKEQIEDNFIYPICYDKDGYHYERKTDGTYDKTKIIPGDYVIIPEYIAINTDWAFKIDPPSKENLAEMTRQILHYMGTTGDYTDYEIWQWMQEGKDKEEIKLAEEPVCTCTSNQLMWGGCNCSYSKRDKECQIHPKKLKNI